MIDLSQVYFSTTLLLCLNHDSFHDHGVIIFQTVSGMHLNNRMVSFGMPSELTTLQIKVSLAELHCSGSHAGNKILRGHVLMS
jgi:hypothetical protein